LIGYFEISWKIYGVLFGCGRRKKRIKIGKSGKTIPLFPIPHTTDKKEDGLN